MLAFPESEKEDYKGKPKFAYVKLGKIKRHFVKDGSPIERDEEYYMNVSSSPFEQTIDNLRKHEGVRVLGFGNFPENSTFGAFAKYLMTTDLAMFNPENPMRKMIEAELRAKLEAESKEKEKPVKPSKGKGVDLSAQDILEQTIQENKANE